MEIKNREELIKGVMEDSKPFANFKIGYTEPCLSLMDLENALKLLLFRIENGYT
jgi:hypothetical protein